MDCHCTTPRFRLTVVLAAAAACHANAKGPLHAKEYKSIPGVQELTGRVVCRRKQEEDMVREGRGKRERAGLRKKSREEIWKHEVVDIDEDVDSYSIKIPVGVDAEGKRWDENSLIKSLTSGERRGLFQFCEPDWLLFPACSNNNDPEYQWHHDTVNSCGAWGIPVTGSESDVTVAIVDQGVDFTHPDLASNRVSPGWNEVNRCWEGSSCAVDDISDSGHGTNVAGIAAAVGNNGIGVSGMGWSIKYRSWRVDNDGGGVLSIRLTRAVNRAADAGDKVINVSYSGVNTEAVRTAGTYAKSKGSLLVWAAGNSNENHNWGNLDVDDVIVVGGLKNDGTSRWATGSQGSGYGPSVDMFAPGHLITTTARGGGYDTTKSGTSFAAPMVSGIIALMWSVNPSLTPDEVEQMLKENCDSLGSSTTFGYGRVNSFEAVFAAKASLPTDIPTNIPTAKPSDKPSTYPSDSPTPKPSEEPSAEPSEFPTLEPSEERSSRPSNSPTTEHSEKPSFQPSDSPASQPTEEPSSQPSKFPTSEPSKWRSSQPSDPPTPKSSKRPSSQPSDSPSQKISENPSSRPSYSPLHEHSEKPSSQLSEYPTLEHSEHPSSQQSDSPSLERSEQPSSQPSDSPTSAHSDQPSSQPSDFPTAEHSDEPSSQPSDSPTLQSSAKPSSQPTRGPTLQPTKDDVFQHSTPQPTEEPSYQPSRFPTVQPTDGPSSEPSQPPTHRPTEEPSSRPSNGPTPSPLIEPEPFSDPLDDPCVTIVEMDCDQTYYAHEADGTHNVCPRSNNGDAITIRVYPTWDETSQGDCDNIFTNNVYYWYFNYTRDDVVRCRGHDRACPGRKNYRDSTCFDATDGKFNGQRITEVELYLHKKVNEGHSANDCDEAKDMTPDEYCYFKYHIRCDCPTRC